MNRFEIFKKGMEEIGYKANQNYYTKEYFWEIVKYNLILNFLEESKGILFFKVVFANTKEEKYMLFDKTITVFELENSADLPSYLKAFVKTLKEETS